MQLESAEYRELLRKYQETKNYYLFLNLLNESKRLIFWVGRQFDENYMVTRNDIDCVVQTSFFDIINSTPEKDIRNIPRFLTVAVKYRLLKFFYTYNSKHKNKVFSYYAPVGGREENNTLLEYLAEDESLIDLLDKWEAQEIFEEALESVEEKYREPLKFRMENYNTSDGANYFGISEKEYIRLARIGRKLLGEKLELIKGTKPKTPKISDEIRNEIVTLKEKNNKISLSKLSKIFGVGTTSIRRILNEERTT